MTLVLTSNVVGQARGEPVSLPNRRRRLSTVVARHRSPGDRRFIVSVHRRGEPAYQPCDRSVRLRADWRRTLVGPQDVVLITVVPAGRGAASIGLAIASIALIALAPYAAPLIAGSVLIGGGAAAGTLATAIQAGMVIGGIGLAYAAQASKATKTKTQELYSVAGGGNLPKPGSRRPLLYGKCWTAPPLSQKDYFRYAGDTMVLTKRMTLGIGKFQIHQVKVGDAVFWNETGGIQPPFSGQVFGNDGVAIEFLYGQPSTLAFADVASSNDVGGQEIPRVNGNPDRTPWFRAQPQGVTTDFVALSWQYPAIMRTSSEGRPVKAPAGVRFLARRIDPVTGAVIGAEFELLRQDFGLVYSPNPVRQSDVRAWPANGAYEVAAQNLYADPVGFDQKNAVTWDELYTYKKDGRIRPATTEIVMRVRAGKGLTITAYSDVTVQATRILPVWTGSAWVEQATRKAVWAYCDLVRGEHGLALPDGVEADKALYYANLLTTADTFDGALPEVSGFWEAASTVLQPLRAEPVKVGPVHSFVRDEPRQEPRHVLTRRQIARDSGGATYKAKVEGSDVVVEFDRDADPKRPDEVRYSYGPQSRTPKRYRVAGISDGAHALRHAKWLAGCAVFRGAERALTTEWDGRLVYPGDHVLSDLWFLQGKAVYGVAASTGTVLTLDCDANVAAPAWGYGSIRTRRGREWGILRMRGQGVRGLELHPDDVSALAASTGLALTDVLARDTQDPTTVVLGDLTELQETWVARSAVPADADHIRIELVRDDPRVWQLVDETPVVPAPIGADPLAEPLVPQISVLSARCSRIETGIEVIWGVSQTAGARNYEADLSYDGGATWEVLSPFGAASNGRAPLRNADVPISIRARAYGRTGLHGDYAVTTFTSVAPIVQGSVVDITTLAPIPYDKLDTDAKARITAAQATADQAAQNATAGITAANARLDSMRRALAVDPKVRAGYVEPLWGDFRQSVAVVTDVVLRLQTDVATLRDNMASAGLEVLSDQGIARLSAVSRLDTAVGERLTSVSVTVDALRAQVELYGSVQTGDLSGLITSITTVRQTLDALQGTVSTLATSAQFDGVNTRLNTAEQTISAQGAAITQKASQTTVDAQGTRLTSVETGLSAAQGRISNLVTQTGTGTVDTALAPGLLARLMDITGQRLDTLAAQVSRGETNISANFDDQGRSVAEMNGRLLAFQGDAVAQFETMTRAIASTNEAVVQQQTLFSAQLGAVSASLASEINVRATADTAQTVRTDGALSRIGGVEAGLTTEQQTRASADNALSSSLTSLTATVGGNTASLTALSQTVADNQASAATQFSGVSARFGALEGRTSQAEANISALFTAYASGDSALSQRIDTLNARVGNAEGSIASEASVRASADNALTSQYNGLVSQVGTNTSSISSLSQAQSSATTAQANINTDLYARSDAGTASGRFYMQAVSAPSGVSVRLAAQASIDSYGTRRNAGWYLDLMPDGTSRFIVDASFFALTANGGVTYPFTFDGTTLTIPSLRVTQSLILPGAVNENQSFSKSNQDLATNTLSQKSTIGGLVYTFTTDYDAGILVGVYTKTRTTTSGNSNNPAYANLYMYLQLDGQSISAGRDGDWYHGNSNPGVVGNNIKNETAGSYTVFRKISPGTHTIAVYYDYSTNNAGSLATLIFGQLDIQISRR